jgi:lipoprotein-releasing system permease protein
MKLPFYIAKRYLFAKKSRNAINVISAISVAGVSVGTMALIIVLSVFNGLEEMVSTIFNTFDPDLKITAAEGKVFKPDSLKLLQLSDLKGVRAYSLTLEENALLRYGERQFIAVIKGVDDEFAKVTRIDSVTWNGNFKLWSVGKRPEAVVGAGVARYLGLNVNFVTQLHIYVPKRTGSINLNPEDAFIDRYITPSGIFEIEQEFDSKYIFIPLEFARELLEYDSEISSIEILTDKHEKTSIIQSNARKIFGNSYVVRNRFELQEIFYRVMRSERLAIFIILTLILLIASFNIIGSLTMLIIEKERDIEILRSLGADNNLIRKIFIFEGWLISIIGAFAGIIMGFIICWLQQRYGLIKLNTDSLIMEAYPVALKLKDFIIVPGTVLLIGYWAAWYPVRSLTKKHLLQNAKKN